MQVVTNAASRHSLVNVFVAVMEVEKRELWFIIFPMKITHTLLVASVVLLTGIAASAQDASLKSKGRRRLSRGPGALSGSASASGALRT